VASGSVVNLDDVGDALGSAFLTGSAPTSVARFRQSGCYLSCRDVSFLAMSFHKNAKIGPAFSSQSRRYPARLWHRITLGFVGVAAIYTGVKIVLLCR
jgi:hypothetical protein